MKTSEEKNHLSLANAAFREGRYLEALELYRNAVTNTPSLMPSVRFNIDFAKTEYFRQFPVSETVNRYAVVIHAYHLDVLGTIARHVANVPALADQFVTFPEDFSQEQRDQIQNILPLAKPVPVPNVGQDVGALFSLLEREDLSQYEYICKVHTKKGSKRPQEWCLALLRGVLGSKDQVKTTLRILDSNGNVILAGSRQLFLFGPANLWKNVESIKHIFAPLVKNFDFLNEDWGFIGGTCFWIRMDTLTQMHACMRQVEWSVGPYVDDGTPSHAAERMFGLLPAITKGAVLLNDAVHLDSPFEIVKGFPDRLPRGRVSISPLLDGLGLISEKGDEVCHTLLHDVRQPVINKPGKLPLKGALDLQSTRPVIMGWLACMGDQSPRTALVKIGSINKIVLAESFRSDLRKHGINQGKHAFSVSVPANCLDGRPYKVALIDADTGTLVAHRSFSWSIPRRDYKDFMAYLCYSMTQPMILAPFHEEDKRCFAVMENIADRLTNSALLLRVPPLVSVIMPVFNREKIVGASIQSILEQRYANFELIVVDDGSSDRSVEVVKSFADPRIRLIIQTKNAGHSVARNRGLKMAKGEIVTYLDSDNTWDERYLAATVGVYACIPDADAVYSGQLLFRGHSREPFAVRYGHFNRALLENKNYIDLNAFSHRMNVLEKVGGFDVGLNRFVDYDFILKISELARLYSVPVLLSQYFYDMDENTVTNNDRYAADMQIIRNHLEERIRIHLGQLGPQELSHKVAVVIPNWESLDDIQDCIASLSTRDWRDWLEIIVVDNHSNTKVVSFLRAQALASQIKLIENHKNYGFTYAVNQGITASRSDADILILNNDAIVLPGAIQALQLACYELPDAGMTVPRQILPAGTKTLNTHVPYANDSYDCDVNLSAHHRNIDRLPLFHAGDPVLIKYAPFFAAYIRRDVVNELGPLDARNGRHYRSDRIYCDLVRQLLDRKIYYVPTAHVVHKLQKSTDALRNIDKNSQEFTLMFQRNQWDTESAAELGFGQAMWDI